jgi:glycosyltransferase involved in cell wall biosynthesis
LSLGKNIYLIQNGFDFNSFYHPVKEKPLLPLKLINVGNFIPKKNQLFLINVQHFLEKKGINTELVLVGAGETMDQVRQQSKKLHLDTVHFTGNTDNVLGILSKADIYVHSAFYEPFGLVILEAMAAGLPVISLDGRGNRDIIQNGVNGFLVEQGNINGFVDYIIKLAEDPELYAQIAREGQKSAEKYDIRHYTLKIINLYNHAVRRS